MIHTIAWSDLNLSMTYTLDLVAPCTLQAIYYDKFLELIENLGNFRIKSEVEKTFKQIFVVVLVLRNWEYTW